MPKVSRWRLLWTVVSIGAAVYVVLNNPVNLGLDLRGGTQVVLEAQDTADVTVDSDVTARTLEVLRRRVDAFGVAEPTGRPARPPAHPRRAIDSSPLDRSLHRRPICEERCGP